MSAKKMSKKMFKNLKSKVGWFEHSTYAQVNHTVRPGLVFVVKRVQVASVFSHFLLALRFYRVIYIVYSPSVDPRKFS